RAVQLSLAVSFSVGLSLAANAAEFASVNGDAAAMLGKTIVGVGKLEKVEGADGADGMIVKLGQSCVRTMGRIFPFATNTTAAALILADERLSIWIATFESLGQELTVRVSPGAKVPCVAAQRNPRDAVDQQLDFNRRFWDQMNAEQEATRNQLRNLQKRGTTP
ncbi:hypothetical protein, partial [Cupriavidus sp. L7L]|uniref:hypothetical protein n=1 Tax=Cupriavidus sp. L7L TaxID=2546443 RepID=UPI0014045FCC